jgi:hypothetical protein
MNVQAMRVAMGAVLIANLALVAALFRDDLYRDDDCERAHPGHTVASVWKRISHTLSVRRARMLSDSVRG